MVEPGGLETCHTEQPSEASKLVRTRAQRIPSRSRASAHKKTGYIYADQPVHLHFSLATRRRTIHSVLPVTRPEHTRSPGFGSQPVTRQCGIGRGRFCGPILLRAYRRADATRYGSRIFNACPLKLSVSFCKATASPATGLSPWSNVGSLLEAPKEMGLFVRRAHTPGRLRNIIDRRYAVLCMLLRDPAPQECQFGMRSLR